MKTSDLIDQGEAYFLNEKYETARGVLQKAIRQDPRKAEIYYWLGRIASEEELPQEAEQHHRKALELNRKYSLSYLELGEIAFERDDFQAALDELTLYMKYQDSPGSSANYLLGHTHYKLGNLESAEDYLRKAIQRRSSFGDAFFVTADDALVKIVDIEHRQLHLYIRGIYMVCMESGTGMPRSRAAASWLAGAIIALSTLAAPARVAQAEETYRTVVIFGDTQYMSLDGLRKVGHPVEEK